MYYINGCDSFGLRERTLREPKRTQEYPTCRRRRVSGFDYPRERKRTQDVSNDGYRVLTQDNLIDPNRTQEKPTRTQESQTKTQENTHTHMRTRTRTIRRS